MALKGLDNVLANLNKEIKKIEGATHKGIVAAGEFIKEESQLMAPLDFGPLRASAFAISSAPLQATIGYTAKYAAAVHESPMTLKGQPRADFGKTRAGVSFGGGSGKGTYWDNGENKFLEKAVKNNIPQTLKIIQKRSKI